MKRHRIIPMEDTIQAGIIQLLKLCADPRTIFCSIPNGMYSSARIGARFVKTGMLPGAADLLIITPDSLPHFMEVKTLKGVQSEPQKAFQARCEAIGVPYVIVKSLREAEGVLAAWNALRTRNDNWQHIGDVADGIVAKLARGRAA